MAEAQHGVNHNGQEVEGNNNNENQVFSEATMRTINRIRQRRTHARKASFCTLHDQTSPGYDWLLPGWVAEERHMASGRVYRYYYDPEANFYKSKQEVIATWRNNNLTLIE